MTEDEWLTCCDPLEMLDFVRERLSDRKLRLFAVACARRVADLIEGEGSRNAILVSERFADGRCGEAELESAFAGAELTNFVIRNMPYAFSAHHLATASAGDTAHPDASSAAEDSCWCAQLTRQPEYLWESNRSWKSSGVRLDLARILREEMTSDPFRPIAFSPTWRTRTVLAIASSAYETRHHETGYLDNDELAILADALEDVGCDRASILEHLRSAGPHVRGCWAVDLILSQDSQSK